ncbi:MFS transporter [Pseudovirgaria hyperparasitica]|uniref:MFS transporter n=1 Tax=Pseudovirgaria hyperparasitica TaxID=470096 RepID=A0A6A6W5X7_9PEZI|nr:MFS transporter [Pseudovirgaria hyperparasitica]KAF2757356.1 MFS transporter [Pseudovirgaria hyperparasitica]
MDIKTDPAVQIPDLAQSKDTDPVTKDIEAKATHINGLDLLNATPQELRRVIRKLDFYLLPLFFILYTFSVLDRSNLGNARLVGLPEDIDVSGNRYEWLGNTFYIAYIVFQFNVLGWKIFKAHKWVAFVVAFWGIASTLQAACFGYGALVVCRFFLGWAETMFGPGVSLYFSYFWPREALGLRFGFFLSGAALANAYGGALAFGLGNINSGISNWRLLFIIEGAPTALLAIVCWFYVPDSPSKARFLNEREKQIAQAYANNQPGDFKTEGLNLSQLGDAFKDYKNWLFALMNFSVNVSFASLPLFLPTIISEFGSFSRIESNGFSAPPYALCFIMIIVTAIVSDKLRLRGPFVFFFALLSAVGWLILATATTAAARYVATFLAVLIFVSVAMLLTWTANTNETSSKRAGGLWIVQTVGQCGTVLGTNMFPKSEAPYYRRGMWVGCAFSFIVMLSAGVLSFMLWRENRRRDRRHGRPEVGVQVDMNDLEDVERNLRYII